MLKNRVFKNSIWIIMCSIAQSLIGLVIGMLTARYLGPSNYGLISYATSITLFFEPIMQLGLSDILVHEIVNSPDEEGRIIGTSIGLSVLSSVLCIVCIFCFVSISDAGDTTTILVCFLFSLKLIFQGIGILRYWFQAKLMSKYTSLVSLAAYTIVALYRVYLLVTQKDITWFAISQSIDLLLIAIMLIYVYRKKGGKHLGLSADIAKRMLSKSKYYIISNMMVVVFAQCDRIMLKFMIGTSSVGFYTAAVTIASMTSFVFVAIIDSFRPTIFEKKKSSKEEYEKYMSMLFSIIIFLSLAQSLTMTGLAKLIVWVLYGSEYYPAVSALQIIVWYTTYSYLGAVRNIWVLSEGKQRYLFALNMSGAIGNVILNLCLIPIWGTNGAALASLITQFFANIVMNQLIPDIRPVNKLIFKGFYMLRPDKLVSNIKILRGKL